ncbi:MAG: hypothetical protein ABS70_02025 [Nitrospira sp. SCN 59-13]|nr:MAG: hypothetical protein ABS70_02025 [Nitrospira sp. SCN 59-13]
MGAHTRAFDWSKTPVGPIEHWPQSLKTAVSIMLGCQYPLLIWWGNELIHFYNDAYIPVLGKRHPSALGQPAPVVWSEAWPLVGPQADAVMQEGRSHWNEELLIVMTRNGYPEEVYMTFSYGPILDDRGRVGGVFCACTEETARVLSRRRLATLRALADRSYQAKSAADACATAAIELSRNPHDIPFAILYLLEPDEHRARLAGQAGLAEGHTVGPTAIDLNVPDSSWPLREVFRSGKSVAVTDLRSRFGPLPGGPWPEAAQRALVLPMVKSGKQQVAGFFVAGLSPRLELDDSYRGFLDLLASQAATAIANACAYDEERRRAEALAELDRAKTVFFSNVSHEFRTPLTLLLGPLEEALRAEHNLSAEVRHDLTVAHRNGLRLLKLVNTLLDFSRIESGRIQACYEPVDYAGFTAELASNFRSAIERAGMRLVIECHPLPEPIWVDREMWEKIVLNLLSNAFKFTFEGDIAVRTSLLDSHAELVISDTGIGIAAGDLPHIFERFHRIREARSRTHEGTGIGLALVQELVTLHGGSIGVTSSPGVGTAFTVRIPTGSSHLPPDRLGAPREFTSTALGATPFVEEALRWLPAEVSVKSAPERQATLVDAGPSSPIFCGDSILLADDNADMRDYVTRLLSGQYHVEAVADGESALRAALEHPPDLVLADIMMPGMDGLDLLRTLRAEPTLRQVPIILLSARAGEEAKVLGLEAGADDYLVKPFAARELLARVRTHLELARERRRVKTELASRIEELEQANAAVRDGRLAALNVLEDAVQARDRAESLNRKLQEEILDRQQAESARMESDAKLASDLAGLRRLHALQIRIFGEQDVKTALAEILAAACDLTGTQRGCIQLVRDDGQQLELSGCRGYADDSPLLQYVPFPWAQPADGASRQRLMIEDVAHDARLAGTTERDMMLTEGVRALHVTPLMSRSGELVGLLSTQFDKPHRPTDDEWKIIDLLALTATEFITRDRTDQTRQNKSGGSRRKRST